jgi:hypothetical protein
MPTLSPFLTNRIEQFGKTVKVRKKGKNGIAGNKLISVFFFVGWFPGQAGMWPVWRTGSRSRADCQGRGLIDTA